MTQATDMHIANLRRIAMIATSPDIREQLEAAAKEMESLKISSVAFDFGVLNTFAQRLDNLESKIKTCATRLDLELFEIQMTGMK